MAAKQTRKRKDDITVVCYLLIDGQAVPVEELTEEQRQRWSESASRRLSENMSEYYSQHPDEYARLCESLDRKESRHGVADRDG